MESRHNLPSSQGPYRHSLVPTQPPPPPPPPINLNTTLTIINVWDYELFWKGSLHLNCFGRDLSLLAAKPWQKLLFACKSNMRDGYIFNFLLIFKIRQFLLSYRTIPTPSVCWHRRILTDKVCWPMRGKQPSCRPTTNFQTSSLPWTIVDMRTLPCLISLISTRLTTPAWSGNDAGANW